MSLSRLIKNELIKIFKKKSLYIAFIIVLLAMILMNCMNRFAYNGHNNQSNIESLERNLANFNPDNPSDTSIYVELKTEIDTAKLIKQYGTDSWQATIINSEMSDILTQLNTYQYGIGKNDEKYLETKKEYDAIIQKLDSNDWKYFASSEREKIVSSIAQLENQKANTIDRVELGKIEEQIEDLKVQKQVIDWRLEKEISYAKSDLNKMLMRYPTYVKNVRELEQGTEKEAKAEYNHNLENAKLVEYSIEHGVNVNKSDDLRGSLMNFFSSNSIFIIILIIIVAGTIISEEFNKGTIKLLLVRPYQRWKIVLAKFIACFITLLITIIVLFGIQFAISSILYGLDSLKTPAVIYNFNTGSVETMPIIAYLGLTLLAKLPMLILTMLIAFMLGGVFNNSALGIIISLLGFMSSDMINMMATEYQLSWMKFFITPNWDLTPYLFGGIPQFTYTTFPFSVIMCLVYFVIMLGFTVYVFQKRNIKNI